MLTNKEIIDKIKLYKERLAIKVYNYKQFTEVIHMLWDVFGRKSIYYNEDSCVEGIRMYEYIMNDIYCDYNIYPLIIYIKCFGHLNMQLKFTVDNEIIYNQYNKHELLVEGLKLLDFNSKEYIPLIRDEYVQDYVSADGCYHWKETEIVMYKESNKHTKYYDMYDDFNFMYYDENDNKIIVDKIILDKNKDFDYNKGVSYEIEYGQDHDFMYVNFKFINNNKCNLSPCMRFSTKETYFCVYTDDKEYDKYKELLTQRLKKDKLDALKEEINKLKENYKDIQSKLLKL